MKEKMVTGKFVVHQNFSAMDVDSVFSAWGLLQQLCVNNREYLLVCVNSCEY
jgi:hypothetical protein